jgi:hypothetical protein
LGIIHGLLLSLLLAIPSALRGDLTLGNGEVLFLDVLGSLSKEALLTNHHQLASHLFLDGGIFAIPCVHLSLLEILLFHWIGTMMDHGFPPFLIAYALVAIVNVNHGYS